MMMPQMQPMESFVQAPMQYAAPQPVMTTSQAPMTAQPVYTSSPAPVPSSMMMPQVQPMESFVQAPVQYGAPQVTTAPPVYMTSPALSPSMTVQQQPAMQVGMAAPQVGYEQLQPEPSMTYSMAPQTMGEAPGMQMVAEPVATRIEPAGGMMMEQQPVPTHIEAMPATTYSAPAATYLAGAQPGVMMGGPTMMGAPVQQEGFLQHAMHSVGNALGLGGSQANTTY